MSESVITYNVFHHVAWGATITVYFWLVGASVGSFLISTLGWVFGIDRYKPLTLTASMTAFAALLLVPVLLVWDLGQPIRFLYLLIPGYWHATGPMSWGTVLICIYPIVLLIYSYFVLKNNPTWAKILGIIGIILALAIRWYAGVVMELNPGRSLNHTALAPLLFLTGAFISGIGLLIIVLWIQNMLVAVEKRTNWSLIREMAQYMVYGLFFDAFLLFLEAMQTLYGSEGEVIGHEEVLLGVFRFPYLWLEIVIGIIIPVAILISPLKRLKSAIVLSSLLVCAGVYGMRVWWVMGGQFLQTFY